MTYGVFTDEFEKTWQAHFLNKTTIQNKVNLKISPNKYN